MAAATALMLGGSAGLGALAGGVKGKQGTQDQLTKQMQSIPDMTPEERALLNQSREQYDRAIGQQAQIEARIRGLDPLQAQAMQGYQDILSGGSFQVTPQEQAYLDQIRQQSLQQGEADLGRFLEDRLSQIGQTAGARNLRGQALTSLQGNALKEAQFQQGQNIRQADQLRTQAQLQLPYQRIAAQSPFLQQGMTLADQLRQQAVQNRIALQDPMALRQLQQNRFAQGTTTNFTPGQKGSWMDAALGAVGGGFYGAQTGANVIGSFQGLGGMGGGGGGGGAGAQMQGPSQPQQINYGMFGGSNPYTR